MGNSRTDTKLKLYKNSVCSICYSMLKIVKIKVINNKEIIICKDCYEKRNNLI